MSLVDTKIWSDVLVEMPFSGEWVEPGKHVRTRGWLSCCAVFAKLWQGRAQQPMKALVSCLYDHKVLHPIMPLDMGLRN